jgi:MEMO1 family protein
MANASIDPEHRPRLRPTLAAEPADDGVLLFDQFRIGGSLRISPLGLEIVKHFNGERTLAQIQESVTRITGGVRVDLQALANLAAALDETLLLHSPRFLEFVSDPIRPPSCIGSYDADHKKLRAQLRKLFIAPGGPGLPEPRESAEGKLRAVLVPHMDYGRGNVTYGWGFKELIDRTDATTFVIVATSHYSPHRFTLTRRHFATPLGVAETNQAYVDRIVEAYGDGLFDDELAHVPEHSIELEVVLLQYLLEKRRSFTIVPLLVGSFRDCVSKQSSPAAKEDIARMIRALQVAEAGCSEPVCYLISGDLAHIGPKFGDERPAAGDWLDDSRRQDAAILNAVGTADSEAYFQVIAEEGDERRICGLPPTYLTLAATRPQSGRVLHYQQYIHPQGHESVSFAAAAFYAS